MLNQHETRFLTEYYNWTTPTPSGLILRFQNLTSPYMDAMRESEINAVLSEFKELISEQEFLKVIQVSVVGVVELLNEAASLSIFPDRVRRKQACRLNMTSFGPDNAELAPYGGIRKSLQMDRRLGVLGGFGEGAITGYFGGPGLLVDIPALVLATMRAALMMSTKHGLEIEDPLEKAFALQAAFSGGRLADGTAKAKFARELHVIAVDVARKKAWRELEEHGLVRLAQKLAEILTIRLTKAKLAAAIPVAGAAISGGFNARWMSCAHRDLEFIYGRRFLDMKHGTDSISEYLKRLENN